MIYISARFANPEHTEVTGTDEFGDTETRSIDEPHEFRREGEFITGFLAGGGVIADYVPPDVVKSLHKLYKSTLIRRLTEQEAVVLTALLDASPVKSKMLWQASDFLMSSDPLFSNLQAAITGALGAKRAAEILATEA